MVGHMICGFILPVLVALAYANEKDRVSARDIKKFLNTEELIWTYNSTARSTMKCRVDMKESITEDSIIFQRSFYWMNGGNWTHKYFRGKFSSWNYQKTNYDTILVNRLEDANSSTWRTEEHLVYQSEDNKCGVFKTYKFSSYAFSRVTNADLLFVDLRLKNSTLHNGPSAACLSAFDKARKKRQMYPRYFTECQLQVQGNKHFLRVIQ
uniref:Lipocalin n=1 Tax=Rhipicephalus zambeziensis TaxID=60191 RepID=A0A224YM85_9ACAR